MLVNALSVWQCLATNLRVQHTKSSMTTSRLPTYCGKKMEMRNIELLDKIIAKIEAEPESWNQGRWAIGSGENAFRDDNGHLQPGPECNTAFCVAGHVAVETGAKFNWMRYGVRIEIEAHHVVGENGHLQS